MASARQYFMLPCCKQQIKDYQLSNCTLYDLSFELSSKRNIASPLLGVSHLQCRFSRLCKGFSNGFSPLHCRAARLLSPRLRHPRELPKEQVQGGHHQSARSFSSAITRPQPPPAPAGARLQRTAKPTTSSELPTAAVVSVPSPH